MKTDRIESAKGRGQLCFDVSGTEEAQFVVFNSPPQALEHATNGLILPGQNGAVGLAISYSVVNGDLRDINWKGEISKAGAFGLSEDEFHEHLVAEKPFISILLNGEAGISHVDTSTRLINTIKILTRSLIPGGKFLLVEDILQEEATFIGREERMNLLRQAGLVNPSISFFAGKVNWLAEARGGWTVTIDEDTQKSLGHGEAIEAANQQHVIRNNNGDLVPVIEERMDIPKNEIPLPGSPEYSQLKHIVESTIRTRRVEFEDVPTTRKCDCPGCDSNLTVSAHRKDGLILYVAKCPGCGERDHAVIDLEWDILNINTNDKLGVIAASIIRAGGADRLTRGLKEQDLEIFNKIPLIRR